MICVKCQKFYRPKKNGVVVEELMPSQRPTDGYPAGWAPYKLWMADLYECPGCGHEAVGGFSLGGPFAEHYQETYQEVRKRYPPYLQIPDCGPTHLGWRPSKNREALEPLRLEFTKALGSSVQDLPAVLDDLQDRLDELLDDLQDRLDELLEAAEKEPA